MFFSKRRSTLTPSFSSKALTTASQPFVPYPPSRPEMCNVVSSLSFCEEAASFLLQPIAPTASKPANDNVNNFFICSSFPPKKLI